ncbi:urease accessory protein UreD [Agromyces sp. ISL-38]|uniref:urease accessory protein UreD n=1 Tax=Agromyces sp. ISL-38 TaxID=2819107 RepID=UPI002034E014|nr:urease accessory protein UreD [Agromyces sp. ISL-38]
MTTTRIAVRAGHPRAHVDLAVGALAPRLVGRTSGTAHVALSAAGMLLLGGDLVHVEVDVGPDCTLELEDVGGMVAYRAPRSASQLTLVARVGSGGTLLWRALPLVVAAGARVERRTQIDLDQGGCAVIRETIVLGREGETAGSLTSHISITDPDGPVLNEDLDVDGSFPEPGILGSARVLDAVVAVGFRPDLQPGAMLLDQPGAVARHLGDLMHESPMDDVWATWSEIAKSSAVPPVATAVPLTAGGLSSPRGVDSVRSVE